MAGIIPAYAGNTFSARLLTNGGGEGSSPRMRGTPIAPDGTVNLLGIIPAYAGNT